MKKIVAFALALMMMITGCAIAMAEEQELATVKILAKGAPEAATGWMDYRAGRQVAEDLAKRGIKLEIETVDPGVLGDIIRTRMAAGVELPDLVSAAWCGIGADEIMRWGHDGLVYSINELCEKYDEDGSIFAFQSELAPGTMVPDMDQDGNIWYFSYLYAPKRHIIGTEDMLTKNPYATLIREDWVHALGEEVKQVYTPQELKELVQRMRKADVNGSGTEDEVFCVNINGFNLNMARCWGLVTPLLAGLNADEEKVVSNFYNPALVNYLEFMKGLYEDGLYDTSAIMPIGDESKSDILTQNRAAVYYQYASWENAEKLINDPTGKANFIPIIVDETGSTEDGWYSVADIAGSTMNYYFVPTACKNPENVVKLMDYVYSVEYAELNEVGPADAYTIDENGIYYRDVPPCEATDDDSKKAHYEYYATTFQAYGLGLNILPAMRVLDNWVYDVHPNDTRVNIVGKRLATRAIINAQKTADVQRMNQGALYASATEEELERLDEITEALNVYASEMLVDIILGKRDIDTLDEGVAQLEKLGLKEYIGIMQARRDRAIALTAALAK